MTFFFCPIAYMFIKLQHANYHSLLNYTTILAMGNNSGLSLYSRCSFSVHTMHPGRNSLNTMIRADKLANRSKFQMFPVVSTNDSMRQHTKQQEI